MATTAPADRRPRGGRADKRRAILAGALTVFARDGYDRASIDTIAAEAQVSTRTIYNHFRDKAELFFTVVRDSTTEVADAQIAIIDAHLDRLADLEPDLIRLGQALATPMTQYAEHFALVRQIDAYADQLPPAALDAWRDAGPTRVNEALAAQFERLAGRGLLRVDDPERTATHFMLLVRGAIPFQHGLGATPEDEIADIVTAGVRAFLHGYLPDVRRTRKRKGN